MSETAQSAYNEFIATVAPDLTHIDKWLSPKEYLGKGADSSVFRYKNKVIKFFENLGNNKSEEQEAKLKFYKNITETVSKYAENEDWQINIRNKSYPLRFNLINGIFWNERFSCWVTVSEFVDGTRLEEDEALSDIGLSPDNAKRIFNEKSEELNNRFRVTGIKLSPLNTKLVNGTLIITDLCTHLEELNV